MICSPTVRWLHADGEDSISGSDVDAEVGGGYYHYKAVSEFGLMPLKEDFEDYDNEEDAAELLGESSV